jgi:Cu(I)-responsive transcriptional regulator
MSGATGAHAKGEPRLTLSRPPARRVGMNIGEAASRSGVSAKMIRHYETIGLLAAERRPNGYRSYGPPDVAVLRFIRHARDLAFPLEEIRHLLSLWRDRGRDSAEVKQLALDHVAALEAKAAAMQALAESLRHLAAHCQGEERPEGPVLAELAGPA